MEHEIFPIRQVKEEKREQFSRETMKEFSPDICEKKNQFPTIAEASINPQIPGHQACAAEVGNLVSEYAMLALISSSYLKNEMDEETYLEFNRNRKKINQKNCIEMRYMKERI